MSRFAKLFFSLLTVAAVLGLVIRAQDIIRQDPLSRLKIPLSSIGIQLQDVTLRHYNDAVLAGTAFIKIIDVRQDHQYLDFFNIEKGTYATKRGPLIFKASEGNYNAVTRQLNVYGGGHVRGKDFNAITPAFLYDQNSSTLSAPGKIQGTLMGGNIYASDLMYHGSTGLVSAKDVNYWPVPNSNFAESELLQEQKPEKLKGKSDTDQSGRTRWHISGDLVASNGIDNFANLRADDGEILVKAPKGQRDEHTDVLTVTGPVYYFSEKANLVCDKAVIYRKEKRAVLTGNVHMLVKPKDAQNLDVSEVPPWSPPVPTKIAESRPAAPPSPENQQQKDLEEELHSTKTARQYPAHIKSDKIEYWYGKGDRHAVITGSPQCYQEFPDGGWRRVVTNEAFYDGEKDELTLKSGGGQRDTRLVDSIGDDLVATQFVVSTKEDTDAEDHYKGSDVEGVYATANEDIPVKNGGNDTGSSPGTPTGPIPTGPIPAGPTPATPTPAPNNPNPQKPPNKTV